MDDSTISLSDSDESSNSDVEITDFSESSSDVTDVSAAASSSLLSVSSASSILSVSSMSDVILDNIVSQSESSTDADQGILFSTVWESESNSDSDQEHPVLLGSSVGLNITVDEDSDNNNSSEYSISSDSGYSKEDIERNTISYKYQVDTMSSFRHGNARGVADNCSICLSAFVNQEDVRRLPCFHLFHTECIDKWLQNNRLCPNCLMDIKTKVRNN